MTEPPATLAEAQAILQTRLPRITKDATGQYGKYADLADVSRELLPILGELGLSFTSRPTLVTREDGTREFVLAYALKHVSGEADTGEYPLSQSGLPQQLGSAITYARRYSLCAVTGAVADEDDDGKAAQDAAKAKPKAAARPARQAAAGSRKLEGADLRAHNALRREGERHDGKLETGIREQDPADPWASVDQNGERQPPGDLPVTYPPGDRQFRALRMHFQRLGYDDGLEQDREERLVFTAALAGSGEISSSKELTQEQVKLALGRLGKIKDRTALLDAVEELKESEGASA